MNVLAVGEGRLVANQVLETGNDLTTVVEDGVGDSGGVNGEEHAVDEGVGGGEISRGVSLVTRLVEHGVLVYDLQDLVTGSGVVPDVVIIDSDVSGVPGIGVPDREDDRGSDERAEENINHTVEGVDEGVSRDSKLVPVPSREGVEAEATYGAGNGSHVDIVRGDPGNPVEVGCGLNDVVGEPEVDEHGAEAVHEPPHPRGGPAIDRVVGLGVKGTLQGLGVS